MRSEHRSALILGVIAAGAALVYASRGTLFSATPIDDETGAPDVGSTGEDTAADNWRPIDAFTDDAEVSMNNAEATPEQRLSAFLYMIRASEHVFPRDVVNDACYGIFYSGLPFTNFSDHPVLTGERVGVKLPDAMCRNAGFSPGCVSTAAGAYQIIKPTWIRVRMAGTWGPRLPDFTPESQDEAARRILQMVGALDAVLAGDFETAIHKASGQWASLPRSTAKQGPKSMQYALARYDEGLSYA